jgi:16S rRNA processing protein RimM
MADHSEPEEPKNEAKLTSSGDGSAIHAPPVEKRGRRPPATQRKTQRPPRTLSETRGPDPNTPLADVWLTIGRIAGTHGVNGDLKMRLLTDHPEHVLTLKQVYLGESREPVTMREARLQPPVAIIHLEGVNTPEDGKALGGVPVRIPATDAKPLEEGEYFLFQLVGLQAVNGEGAHLGAVTDLMETGAHDVFVITPEGAAASDQLLVPNHPQYVLRIAPEEGLIVIEPPVYGN